MSSSPGRGSTACKVIIMLYTKMREVSQSEVIYTVSFFKQNSVSVIDKLGFINPGHFSKNVYLIPQCI